MPGQHNSGAPRRHAGAIATALYLLAPAMTQAAYRDDVQFTQLQAELGAATPTGAGVVVSQIESAVDMAGLNWMVESGNAEFTGKSLTAVPAVPAPGISAHATAVGKEFYGTVSSIAPDITNVSVYSVNGWFYSYFLKTGTNPAPVYSTSRIANHSWIGSASTTAASIEGLRRLDWVIETDDFIHVAAQGSSTPLVASAFNVIAAGNTDRNYGIGTAALDTIYVAGRIHPHVVVPATSISLATPRVSAAAALLVQTAHADAALSTDPVSTGFTNRAGLLIRNAERAEVIKAALMAGADRVTHNTTSTDLPLYRAPGYNTTNGLDWRNGAGQVNVQNSYHIITAGEQNSALDGGPGSGTATSGFDYDPAFGGTSGNATGTYALPVSATPRLLTAALVWHIDINGGNANNFNESATVRNLTLDVINTANPGTPVFTSQSAVDNTENVWLVVPANASYELRVTRASTAESTYDYGIAWQLMDDADGDGAYDAQDNCINVANGPIVQDSGSNSQRDTDGDGYGNVCDGDLNNNGVTNAQDYAMFRALLGSTDADADLNGNGVVNSQDYAMFRTLLGYPPGPSGIAP